MSFEQKYLKYKAKYLALKNQLGGAPLDIMPQICFGTVQARLNVTLPLALSIGYRHIDGAEAEAYGSSVGGKQKYYKIIRDAIKVIPRNQLWITWKDNNITLDKIRIICDILDCGYIDLFLVHHSCGEGNDFVEFKKAQAAGLIRYYGVSNCENLETIRRLKAEHNIFANQIQARPPRGKVIGRELFNPPNFIEECNRIGVHSMLFGTMSGVQSYGDEVFGLPIYENMEDINKYYIHKYILGTNNVLMVGSIGGSKLQQNFIDINDILVGRNKLDALMHTIETKLEAMKLIKK